MPAFRRSPLLRQEAHAWDLRASKRASFLPERDLPLNTGNRSETDAHNERTASYLLGPPLLPDYLEEALHRLGESECQSMEATSNLSAGSRAHISSSLGRAKSVANDLRLFELWKNEVCWHARTPEASAADACSICRQLEMPAAKRGSHILIPVTKGLERSNEEID